jgi:integrase
MLRRMYYPLQVRAGLTTRYGFHALRHAAASGWIESNIDLKRLQVWIGHENIQLTLDTYGHLLKDKAKDAELALKASRDLFG